jgi:uncharacterized protein YjbI with pentapeptide repeats
MNVYLHYISEDNKDKWTQNIIGFSNYDINIKETLNFHKKYMKKNIISDLIKNNLINYTVRFFHARNIHMIDWQNDIPIFLKKVELEKINIISFPKKEYFDYMETCVIKNCNLIYFPWKHIPNRLRTLTLSFNNFKGHINLSNTCIRFLDLSYNNIEFLDLPYDCNTVNVSHNNIKQLDFSNPMMFANFSFNCIEEFTGSKWLEKCNLSHNKISKVNFHNSSKLQEIDLSFNYLEGESSVNFEKCKLLTKINLSNNQLTWVEGIQELKQLDFLDVSHNKIETMIIPIIKKSCFNNNPLQYFEWNYMLNDDSNGFSFTNLLNSNSGNQNPMIQYMTNYVQKTLKMDKIDELYKEKENNIKISKKFVDLSNTNIQEFPNIENIDSKVILNINFYNNDYIEIPFHPRVKVHVSENQINKWESTLEAETKKKINLLKNQQFYITEIS